VNGSRARIVIRGAVQGVGFRPFVYRLATEMSLAGWVSNSSQGILIEAEGSQQQLEIFLLRIEKDKPLRSSIQSLEFSILDAVGFPGFEIRKSENAGKTTALVLPDIATCSDCLEEIFNPGNRRYLYPFTNCTNCGPRFTIIESLPYDRPNTSMKIFLMCEACRTEYENPADRRFHAQPNACPECGPSLELWDNRGKVLAGRHEALLQAAESLRNGKILALKGVGGFQLLVDARNHQAVLRVRERKHREEKPFALMYGSLRSIKPSCEVSDLEQRLLLSPECPIVLLQRRKHSDDEGPTEISSAVAPGNPHLGVMLPYSPLHHILMRQLNIPLVATSGNVSDEPICTDEREALQRLGNIADLFLVHNRPIVRHVDDSVAWLLLGREQILRRARGYAPLPILIDNLPDSILAVGAHLKNTVAITVPATSTRLRSAEDEVEAAGSFMGHRSIDVVPRSTAGAGESTFDPPGQVFISQHIGDLETEEAFVAFRRVVADFRGLYGIKPELVACDLHPDYLSSQYAREYASAQGVTLVPIQHHYAHVASCMAENQLEAPVLGVSWDGTGLGLDDTIWGGEFLLVNESSFQRVSHFRCFRLPGGEAAIREPKRAALGLLYELFGDRLFERGKIAPIQQFRQDELSVLRQMLEKEINSPRTTSVGRLFDAVASIVDLRHKVSFEGQAALELEFARQETAGDECYHLAVGTEAPLVIDWGPMIDEMLADLERGVPVGRIAAKFHNALVEVIVEIAHQIEEEKIVLTGGCFQNRYLLERVVQRLAAEGFRPYWHQRVPSGDGGIALGQVLAAARSEVLSRSRRVGGVSLTA